MNINDNKIKAEPIDSLANESKFDAFICKEYPISCEECLDGWHSICKVDRKEKGKSFLHARRPVYCPLSKVTYQYDMVGYKYPGLTEAEWILHNPILNDGGIVISLDLSKVKVGDGKHRYTELPFISLSENSKDDEQDSDQKPLPISYISFSLTELNDLYTFCNSELISLIGKKSLFMSDHNFPTDASTPYIDKLSQRITEIGTLKQKLFDYIKKIQTKGDVD